MVSNPSARSVRFPFSPVLLLPLFVLGAAPSARADVLSVPQVFASIQAAVDAAVAGDVIEVDDGTYAESVLIERRADLDLVAVGAATLDASGFETGILIRKSDRVRVKGFKIVDADEDGIRVAGSRDVILYRNRIKRAGDDCIELDDTLDETPSKRVRVDRNRLRGCGSHGVEIDANRVSIEDNEVRNTGSDAIELNGGRIQQVVRNRIVNASDDGIEVDTGSVLLRRNRIARTQKDGIALNSHRNILLRNIIVRVGRCAVDDRGRKNHLEGNRLEDGVEFDCIGRHNDD